jgi:hypothetical protein
MLLLVLVFPFLGFLSGSLFGRSLGLGISFITTFFTFLSFLLSATILFNVISTGEVYIVNFIE